MDLAIGIIANNQERSVFYANYVTLINKLIDFIVFYKEAVSKEQINNRNDQVMNLNEANIKKIVEGSPVGDFSPFTQSNTKMCDEYAKSLCTKIKASKLLETILESDNYGSGYASYFDLFITKKDKSFYIQKDTYVEISGFSLYISRLAPIAVLGAGKRTRSKNGSSFEFLNAAGIDLHPGGDWSRELNEIRNLLNIYKYSLLSRAEVEKLLWFDVEIPTIMDSETLFDALFYWAD